MAEAALAFLENLDAPGRDATLDAEPGAAPRLALHAARSTAGLPLKR